MGSHRSLRERLLLATLAVMVAALIVIKSPSRVESREPSDRNAAQAINAAAGWERGFPALSVGP